MTAYGKPLGKKEVTSHKSEVTSHSSDPDLKIATDSWLQTIQIIKSKERCPAKLLGIALFFCGLSSLKVWSSTSRMSHVAGG
ncbi:MAG: hypothetical protein ACPGWR_24885, partial [Ardenticatenaceae bacterium]